MSSPSTNLAPLASSLGRHVCTVHRHAGKVAIETRGTRFVVTPALDVDPMSTTILTLNVDTVDHEGSACVSVWGATANCVWITGTDPIIDWDAAADTIHDGIERYLNTMVKAGAL